MARISDEDVFKATSNGDGTHSGVKLVQWLFEATTGKTMSDADAKQLCEQAVKEGRERLARRQAEGKANG